MPRVDLMDREVTVIIPTWQRPENLPHVIASIRKQTVASYVFVFDNGAATEKPFTEHDLADCVFSSTVNFGCWARFPLMGFVRTPYVWQMDDDLHFTQPDVLERYIGLSKELGDDYIIGAQGRVIGPAPKAYQAGRIAPQGNECVMVNTGFTLFPSRLISVIPYNPAHCGNMSISDEDLHNADDPWVNAFVKSYVAPWSEKDGARTEYYGIRRLPELGLGVSHEPGGMEKRNVICEKFLREKEAALVGAGIIEAWE